MGLAGPMKKKQNKIGDALHMSKDNIEKKKHDLVSKSEDSSKEWRSLYKSILNVGHSPTLGLLKDCDIIVINELQKDNLHNYAFVSQTILPCIASILEMYLEAILDDKIVPLFDLPPFCNQHIDQKVESVTDVYKVLNGLDISKTTVLILLLSSSPLFLLLLLLLLLLLIVTSEKNTIMTILII